MKRLFMHSGNRCAFPKCTSPLEIGTTVVGEICHIEADRPGGPRYNDKQSPTDRQGYDNLILLCANHHTVIDNDVDSYTVARLKAMKADHETGAVTLNDADASIGASLLLSVNQSGGVAAQSIGVVNNYTMAPAPAESAPAPTGPALLGIGGNVSIGNLSMRGNKGFGTLMRTDETANVNIGNANIANNRAGSEPGGED
jgi:hypothetical protein